MESGYPVQLILSGIQKTEMRVDSFVKVHKYCIAVHKKTCVVAMNGAGPDI